MTNMCLQCGKCCFIYDPTTKKDVACYHLSSWNGKYVCAIWQLRLGRETHEIMGIKHYCNLRVDTLILIDGCPYNDRIKRRLMQK